MNDTRIQPYHWIEGIAQLLAQTLVARLNQGAKPRGCNKSQMYICICKISKCVLQYIYIYICTIIYTHIAILTQRVSFHAKKIKKRFNLVPARARAPHNVCLGTLTRTRGPNEQNTCSTWLSKYID